MTAQELAAIAEMRGELNGVEKRLGRVEDQLRTVATKSDISELRTAIEHERESVVEFRIEDIARRERELKEQLAATSAMRRSMSPKTSRPNSVTTKWFLGAIGTLAMAIGAAIATWLAT